MSTNFINSNVLFGLLILLLLNIGAAKKTSLPPFIQPDTLHPALSQFEINLILNENRNLPVFLVQYSKSFMKDTLQNIIIGAFSKQPGIALALMVDCRNFHHDLNNTLNICHGFDPQVAKEQQEKDLQIQSDKRGDNFFRLNFMAPNPSRIKQKGHLLSKNHDSQNLRELKAILNDQFLGKIIRNQVPDFVTYIQDSYDMDQFLEVRNEFRTSKSAKILFFDQNLQSPLFLKKLAARLDGRIKVGVTDNFKLAKKYDAFTDALLLMEYNYFNETYDTKKVEYSQGNQLVSILESESIKQYLQIKKYRDILLDFEYKESLVYNMSTLSQINQLISHGRIIIFQISSKQHKYECNNLQQLIKKYGVFLNYICFDKSKVSVLQSTGLKISTQQGILHIIDKSLRNWTQAQYNNQFSIYDYLPQTPPRQKVSAYSEAEMCIKTAMASKRDAIFYWYNQKQHRNTLKLLQYFNSLPQVTSLIHFCQIVVPDKDLMKQFQLHENCLFTMMSPNYQRGEMQKLQFDKALQFLSVKMFIRQLSINQMIKVYDQKLNKNQIKEIHSAEQLTQQCYNRECIVGLIATNKFRYESELQTLKELKLEISDQSYNFVWIDVSCHWDILKQLKLIDKKQKEPDRSYILYYKEKSNSYNLMKSIQDNKYWMRKDVKKWLKSLKEPGAIKSLKFGIDIEDKKCQKRAQRKQQKKVSEQRKRGQKTVKQQQL